MKPSRNICGIMLSLFFSVGSALAQDGGSIFGTVVDEAGAPISGARVNASLLDSRPMSKLIRYVESDGEGRFLIDRLEWGKYGVFAMKEEFAYPDMAASLYSNGIFPIVVIAPSSPVAELRIQLGPKAAVLTGSVTSAIDGAPVDAGFTLTRAASPHKWLSTSAPPNYRILLPSSTDVLLEVSAPGFKTWSPPAPLRLQPGAEMRLDIALEPAHDPNLHPSEFLVPGGYVGWLLLEYNIKEAEPVSIESGTRVFRFPPNGKENTSSTGPERGAEDHYLYYSEDGSVRDIPTDYRRGKGMIWGQYEGSRGGVMSMFGFFIGSEEQYKKYQSQAMHPGPLPTQ